MAFSFSIFRNTEPAPRSSRPGERRFSGDSPVVPWLLFGLLWLLVTGLLVFGSRVATVIASAFG
jgi:hypothetical protein